eukprot:UN24982
MPKKSRKSRRRAAQKVTSGKDTSTDNPYKARPKNFSAGCDIRPKTHRLGRMMRWPKYIRIQRQEQVLKKRLKVPSAIALFGRAADKSLAQDAFKLFAKYQPPTAQERSERRKQIAKARSEGKEANLEHKKQIKFGLNHVTNLITRGKAQVVLIAHDVEPLELVIWLPTLCQKMGVPFMIVKGKAALGKLVRMKNATCVTLTEVEKGNDTHDLELLKERAMSNFNNKFEEFRKEKGGGIPGFKTQHRLVKAGKNN